MRPHHYQEHGTKTGCLRPDLDGDEVMRDIGHEEMIARRAYESGRADERRRLLKAMMDVLEPSEDTTKDTQGHDLSVL